MVKPDREFFTKLIKYNAITTRFIEICRSAFEINKETVFKPLKLLRRRGKIRYVLRFDQNI